MKLFRLTAAALVLAALAATTTSTTTSAQQPAAGARTPAAPASTVVADGKIAIINMQAFTDPKVGIARLVNAYNALEKEFAPRNDELKRMQAQYRQIADDITKTRGLADEKTLNAKAEQAQNIEKEMKRKQEDGQIAAQKREQELTEPIWKDIDNALRAFARARNITVIFDYSKMGPAMYVANEGVDITAAFIAEYNQRNPAATASTAAPGAK
ncbi:MAG TPA: OmpH family outer membrane protein [Pyrinomonadaceae bacterium]|nr:OmpH family outer membrane protein [Pyrinomonadaceae bacterium]